MTAVLECFLECLRLKKDEFCDVAEWNCVDQVLEKIFSRMHLEQDAYCNAQLFLFVASVGIMHSEDEKKLKKYLRLSKEPIGDKVLADLREACSRKKSLVLYRWLNQILNIMKEQMLLGWSSDNLVLINVSTNSFCLFLGLISLGFSGNPRLLFGGYFRSFFGND